MQGNVIRGVDQDVIHIDRNVSFINKFVKEEVHHGLEGGWGVCQAEKHDHWFKKAAVRLKGRFPLVSIVNAYIVVSPPDVQLCEKCRSATVHPCESIHQFSYEW